MATSTHEQVALDTFLAGLPDEVADQTASAALEMQRNEMVAATLRGVETELRPFFISGVLSFVVAFTFLVFFSKPGGFLDRVDGAWPILTAALAFLPGVLVYYAFRIRARSEADAANARLNQEHFLPHGAIYFPSDSGRGQQMVTLVDMGRRMKVSRYDHLKPGTIW